MIKENGRASEVWAADSCDSESTAELMAGAEELMRERGGEKKEKSLSRFG